jgi:hypothetical protein
VKALPERLEIGGRDRIRAARRERAAQRGLDLI